MSEQTTHRAKRSKPRTQYSDLGPETIETFPIATLGPTDPILDPSGRMHVLSGTDDQGSSISAMVKDIAPPSDIFPPREQRSGSLDDSAEAMSFGLEFLTDRDDYSRPPTIQHSASFEGLAVIGSIVQDASSNLQPGVAMEGLSSSLTNSKPKTKRQSQTQKIEEKTEIEIGESIQKSTIMVKRLRSKSESKKSECDCGTEKDIDSELHELEHANKRHIQEHWNNSAERTIEGMDLPSRSPARSLKSSAREGNSCIFCSRSDSNPRNQLLTCKGCDRICHRLCINPSMNHSATAASDREWTCLNCAGSGKNVHGFSSLIEDMSLAGHQVPQGVKESYLNSLSKESLVGLIMRIEFNAPSMKLYPSRLSFSAVSQSHLPNAIHSAGMENAGGALSAPAMLDSSSQGNRPSPMQGVQGAQGDYFESLVAHFQPSLDSPSSIQTAFQSPTANEGSIVSKADPSGLPASTVAQLSLTMNATTTSTTSQPATPTIAKPTRSTLDQRQDMGTGIPMTFASSKAQDLPPYEEMIFMAIADLKQEAGSAPKAILDWVQENFPVPETFRASCGQAISKAAKKGRLLKEGALYKLKPGYIYPRRVSRYGGPARVRSQSYTSGLPLAVSSIDTSSARNNVAFDQMNVVDTNLYSIVSNSGLPYNPQTITPTNYMGQAPSGSGHTTPQTTHSFKFEPRPLGNSSPMPTAPGPSDNRVGPVNPAIATEKGELTSGNQVQVQGLSNMASLPPTPGHQQFTGTILSSGTTSSIPPQRLQRPARPSIDRSWTINTAIANQLTMASGNSPSYSVLNTGVPQARAMNTPASMQFNNSTFGNLSPMAISPQDPSSQSPSPFSPHNSLMPSPLSPHASVLGAGTRMGGQLYSSIFIPQNMTFQPQQQHPPHTLQTQQRLPGQLTVRPYGSISLPASPQDMAPQLLPSQTLFQDPTRLQSYLENTQQQQQQQLGSIRIPHDPTNGNGNNAVHNGPGVIDSNRPILQSNVGVGALTPNAMAIYQQHMQMAYQRQQQQQPQQQQQQQATQHLQHLQQQQQK